MAIQATSLEEKSGMDLPSCAAWPEATANEQRTLRAIRRVAEFGIRVLSPKYERRHCSPKPARIESRPRSVTGEKTSFRATSEYVTFACTKWAKTDVSKIRQPVRAKTSSVQNIRWSASPACTRGISARLERKPVAGREARAVFVASRQ